MMNTMTVEIIVSRRVGQVTLWLPREPAAKFQRVDLGHVFFLLNLAGAVGLEPTTCGFGDRRSTN